MIHGNGFVLLLSETQDGRRSELVELMYGGTLALADDGTVIDADHVAAGLLESNDRSALIGRRVAELFATQSAGIAATQPSDRRRMYFVSLSGSVSDAQQALLKASIGQTVVRSPPVALRAPPVSGSARSLTLEELAGGDPQMLRNIRTARRVADSDLPMLIQGPTGSGKEAFAHAVHAVSRRAGRPFVAVNCAAIPETLIESELFGYRPGAFTGARREGMKGRILRSHGGTLFLDEIGDMPLALQTRLLRVLEDSEIVPLGSETPVKVDLHVIAASHRNLREMIAHGAFREDLYYRLNGITLELPPLTMRADREHVMLRVLAAESGEMPLPQIEPEAALCLSSYSWPGNIRELRNVIRTALAMREGNVIREIDLPREIREAGQTPGACLPGTPADSLAEADQAANPADDLLKAAERAALLQAIESCRGNMTRTAEQLGVSRNTLYRKIKRHGIAPTRRVETFAA